MIPPLRRPAAAASGARSFFEPRFAARARSLFIIPAACLLSACAGVPDETGDDVNPSPESAEEPVREASQATAGAGDCHAARTTPRCGDDSIEACVCAHDSYCCQTAWDALCVGEVNSLGCERCDVAHASPRCNNAGVESCVCGVDPYCCNNAWDALCVSEASTLSCAPALADRVVGTLRCAPPGGSKQALGLVPVAVPNQGSSTTSVTGAFTIPMAYRGGSVQLKLTYQGPIKNVSKNVSTELLVTDDALAARSEEIVRTGELRSDGSLDLGVIDLGSTECELWRLGARVLDGYQAVRGTPLPGQRLRIRRAGSAYTGGTHTEYDTIVVHRDFFTQPDGDDAEARAETLYREFGHVIRNVADGTEAHWAADRDRWSYFRAHDGSEVTDAHFAFNEGWASFWARARDISPDRYCLHSSTCDTPWSDNRDWNERLVANRLLDLLAAPNIDRSAMIAALESNPGAVHSLHDFEVALAAGLSLPPFPAPPSCPPGWADLGTTCQRPATTVGKDSYIRGYGQATASCGGFMERQNDLCYTPCASGYEGNGPVCWQRCPSGYIDDGASCRLDASIISADNSHCPWYDLCGIALADGCTICPAGYQNDGCTCRRDVHIIWKDSYGRGAGTVPTSCYYKEEYDAGLCYPRCNPGYEGIGTICWEECPKGWTDQGATCYLGSAVISK